MGKKARNLASILRLLTLFGRRRFEREQQLENLQHTLRASMGRCSRWLFYFFPTLV